MTRIKPTVVFEHYDNILATDIDAKENAAGIANIPDIFTEPIPLCLSSSAPAKRAEFHLTGTIITIATQVGCVIHSVTDAHCWQWVTALE